VVSGTDRTAQIVRERFPQVRLVALAEPALPGAARNAGLAVARGEFISFPGSHVELLPGSLASRVRAHERGYAMVTGSILNGTRTPAGWASYFLDHSTALPGRPSARLAGPPAHCSYVREFLVEAGGFPEDMRAGEDTVVNRELHRRGHPAYREQDLHLVHRSRCETPGRLIAHHFRRGRAMGRILCDDHRDGRRLLRAAVLRPFLLAYVTRRMRRTDRNVARWGGELRSRYRRVRPLVLAGSVAAWAGIWREVLRPVPGRFRTLFRSG
jgi:glycosyltransferase involved in cell wall biosynthesis